ncbi:396d5f3f-0249-4d50-badf-5ad9e5184062 [Sclerotinia trifoliorum]|uniref:396d5f3f-0249-4d50-badf-5ad9e5184062 n=1 Tax=Sclerotinia trifoliorum TaxID=28548 RepID=A0A8H2ZNQ3_9HELO|nr:396d5f3f-0249-4d50-badf-5ad9e5184062 [Sclerotinia trifoliorum]
MATVPPGKQPLSRERGYSGISTGNGSIGPSGMNPLRPRASIDKASIRNGSSIRTFQDSSTPPSLPKGFEGMLKTTTETGDIGLFSIKPSRLPQSSNTLPRRSNGGYRDHDPLQRPRPIFQTYGAPIVDDRRRLPSYTRKGSSGIKSLYDSSSVKSVNSSNRGFEDPDYRSYSMTQTASNSAYTLSNQRSYASLRSQQDGAVLVQRPRSPFAYPTRLRRPGFRPSSPALTDGGGVDYSRRAEIDRIPYGAVRNVSSPASLYAQKRVPPPLSLRPEANRSTPSLLSQPSPKRRTPSPNLRQGNGMTGSDWHRRNGPASINTSPARSTLSLASTTNFVPTTLSQSATNTPGKPSPLYYDYTEDFEVENQNRSNLEPPPQFQLQRTIHEDRPLSSALLPLAHSFPSRLNGSNTHHLRASSSASTIIRHPTRKNSAESTHDVPNGVGHVRAASSINAENGESSASSDNVPNDSSSIDMSNLGANAQELNSRVSMAFGLLPSSSFEVKITPGSVEIEANQAETTLVAVNSMIAKTRHQQRSSSLPTTKIEVSSTSSPSTNGSQEITTNDDLAKGIIYKSDNQSFSDHSNTRKRPTTDLQQPAKDADECDDVSKFDPMHASRVTSSGVFNIDTGLDELANLMPTDDPGRSNTFGSGYPSGIRRTPMMSPTLPRDSYFDTPSVHRTSPPLPPIKKLEKDYIHSVVPDEGFKDGLQVYERRLEKGKLPSYRPSELHNLSEQVPSKIMPRPESPMLAPKPISPARELKLKNSVPQLMKSLPKLPDSSIRGLTVPGRSAISDANIACHFSEILSGGKFKPVEEGVVVSSPIKASKTYPSLEKENVKNSLEQAELIPSPSKKQEVESIKESHGPRSSPMKLKLKVRNPVVEKPSSSELGARKNEDTSSWANLQDNTSLLNTQEEQGGELKPVKLKLRLTRATGSEPSGTVRIYNDSGDQSNNDLNIPCPKDLFTPTTGFDNIFRHVSRHLHSRRPSANSDQQLEDGAIELMPSQLSLNVPPRLDLGMPHSEPSGNLPSPSDARSFFSDDSSHRNGNHGLRKRISNFRARVGVPYVARNGSYSCDDIVWRDQSGGVGQSPLAAKSVADLNATRASFVESPNPRRPEHKLHAHRLRAKVSEWFRGARAAISARVKLRSTTNTGNERSRASA